jgi:hypothetical protein
MFRETTGRPGADPVIETRTTASPGNTRVPQPGRLSDLASGRAAGASMHPVKRLWLTREFARTQAGRSGRGTRLAAARRSGPDGSTDPEWWPGAAVEHVRTSGSLNTKTLRRNMSCQNCYR